MEQGKKMALLVGCNYPKTPYELRGCHNDVRAMRNTLVDRFGFETECVELLVDEPGALVMPTGANIKKVLNNMVDQAEEGDVLFFHYSGHGTLIKQHFPEKGDEAIVPCHFNLMTSADFRLIVNRVPRGATFTILSDSCHSGGLIDKEKEQIGPSMVSCDGSYISIASCQPKEIPFGSILQYFMSSTGKLTTDIRPHLLEMFGQDASLMFRLPQCEPESLKPDEGILLSGCKTNETSADVEIAENGTKACGAFSNAVQIALTENPGSLSNKEIVLLARKTLLTQHFIKQHPCLYCSDENADAMFLSSSNKSNPIETCNAVFQELLKIDGNYKFTTRNGLLFATNKAATLGRLYHLFTQAKEYFSKETH